MVNYPALIINAELKVQKEVYIKYRVAFWKDIIVNMYYTQQL